MANGTIKRSDKWVKDITDGAYNTDIPFPSWGWDECYIDIIVSGSNHYPIHIMRDTLGNDRYRRYWAGDIFVDSQGLYGAAFQIMSYYSSSFKLSYAKNLKTNTDINPSDIVIKTYYK